MIKKILEWTILGGLAASYLGVLAYINWPRMLKKILGYTILAGLAASYLVALAYIIDFLQGLAIIGGVVLVIGLLILGIWLVS